VQKGDEKMTNSSKLKRTFLIVSLLAMLILSVAVPVSAYGGKGGNGDVLNPYTRFYVPKPIDGARQQIADLIRSHDKVDARLIKVMITTPQAVWFNGGTPHKVQQDVKNTVKRAAAKRQVPVLVAYNIPFRDCSQFSAGGTTSVAEYEAWIDGFAAGIGNAKAVVILEPDGLGIIPWYKQFRGTDAEAANYEWCQPAEANEATAADERFEMLNYAVDALKAKPNVLVYLDGTHSSWLGSGDAAHRLIQAGVERADGFFLNVSNYRFTDHLVKYGQWISDCVYLSQNSWWQVQWCASQYYPANPNDFSTWGLSDAAYDQAFANTGLTRNPDEQAHFVIDSSRNGQGPWTPTTSYPDPQDWCNPPDRGVGLRPTADTGKALLDAYLWVKIPGASDGECTRGLGPGGTTVDPEWGLIDPAAGNWFPEMALDLVQNANPPLLP
jgi:endoglucanase